MSMEVQGILARWRQRATSGEIALMELLIETESVTAVRQAVEAEPELLALLDSHETGCARIVAMLRSGVDSSAPAHSVADGIAFAQKLFDWSVAQNEEASVALYSLGSPEVLARATAEVIEVFESWAVLGPAVRALEIGCGIGRLLLPLAEKTQHILGLDVSQGMVEAAHKRCGHDARIEVRTCSGADLLGIEDHSVELVLAVDSFPYVVQAGQALVDGYFAEVARVLAPGGHFALMNFSYRGDPDRDRVDVGNWAERHGFQVHVAGTNPFKLWNGLAFLLQAKRSASHVGTS